MSYHVTFGVIWWDAPHETSSFEQESIMAMPVLYKMVAMAALVVIVVVMLDTGAHLLVSCLSLGCI